MKKKFDEIVKVKPLKLKGKFNREEIYDWLKIGGKKDFKVISDEVDVINPFTVKLS